MGDVLSREAIEQTRELAAHDRVLVTNRLADSHEALRAERDEWREKWDAEVQTVGNMKLALAECVVLRENVEAERDRLREALRRIMALPRPDDGWHPEHYVIAQEALDAQGGGDG